MTAKSERRAFEAEMHDLDKKIAFWLGFTIGAAACGFALIVVGLLVTP